MKHDAPPCNSFDAASEERGERDHGRGTSAATTYGDAEDQSPSTLFFISSENQILPRDDTNLKESTERMLLDPILETHNVADRPSINPLPLKLGSFQASALSTTLPPQDAVPLASPEAFSDTCSLPALDYAGSKRGAKSSADPMGVHRSASLSTAKPHAPLQKRCSAPPKHGELTHNDTRNCFRDSTDLNKSGAPEVLERGDRSGAPEVLERGDSLLLFHSEYGCSPQVVANSPKDFAVPVQNDSFLELQSPDANEVEIATIDNHSPDRDSMRFQFLYDGYLGHYSPAGRGYPHGFGCCTEHVDFQLPEIHETAVVRPSCGLATCPEFKVSQQTEVAAFSKSLDYENHRDLKVLSSHLS